ncbi:acyl carrier protein [Streptomyces sp. NPDC005231]|uniref:acyl carrier protein n=1 Tax=Streptomyces sp. NPDC005231 TaxID=3157026 RepID=UPI00339FFFE3
MSVAYDRLVSLLTLKLGVASEDVAPDITFEELEVDSLALVELTDILDAEFGVKLEEGSVRKDRKLAEVASILEQYENGRS